MTCRGNHRLHPKKSSDKTRNSATIQTSHLEVAASVEVRLPRDQQQLLSGSEERVTEASGSLPSVSLGVAKPLHRYRHSRLTLALF
ncbi:hypothetical protein TNIN_170751 [Trichonephila inaurata madagascariensis]|uniref:Uncharacterized protein n=1 Tax=Trichonephila inaurata madagascariensis TaxID=2747483 RepID=A0A8X6KFY3_9ARAC|nr:hypothetical protein TNIN_170751 [Trichonephila inaurata madagascariensis]